MEQKETIMICLNVLGIGGVETAVLNQTITFIRKGYRVVILAKDGIYKTKFEEAGAICIDFEYSIEKGFNQEKINKILEIIKNYNVKQIHVEQFICVNDILPVLLISKIKYVAYLHNGIQGEYDWFFRCFQGYKEILNIFFKNAYKIISITEKTKKENMEIFNIEEEKYRVLKNAIDFKEIEDKYKEKGINEISKFMIISRIDRDKKSSVINAIDLFKQIKNTNPKATLTIVGDGEERKEIEEYATNVEINAEFLGQRNDVLDIIDKHDCVLGLGRCLVEGIALRKIAIVCGYDKKYILVKPSNIEVVSENNFTEREKEGMHIDELISELYKLDNNEISKIITGNYKYIYENLNIDKNIFIILNEEMRQNDFDMNTIVEYMMKLQQINEDLKVENKKVFEEGQKAIKWHLDIIEKNNKEIEYLNSQIQESTDKVTNNDKSYIKKIVRKIKTTIKNKLKIS